MRRVLVVFSVAVCAAQVLPTVLTENLDVPNDGPARSADRRVRDPQFCLRPPYVPDDNTRWEVGGASAVEPTFVRLTPNQPSKSGFLYARQPSKLADWEALVEFSITGASQRGGGEGMGFWYTSRRIMGPVFGGHDYWDGLGVLIDTYDNDRRGANPLITVIYNDGTRQYSASDDGLSQALGTCVIQLRNSPTTVFLRVTYLNKNLLVEVAKDYRNSNPVFTPCVATPVDLGIDKYFGVTAATGHPLAGVTQHMNADRHDVYRVEVFNLGADDDKLLQERRDSYQRERMTNHEQNKDYREVTDVQFYNTVATSLNQMVGLLAQMDNTEVKMERQIHLMNAADRARDAFDESSGAAIDSPAIKSMLNQVLATHQQRLRQSPAQGGEDAGQLAGVITSKQELIAQEMDLAKTALLALQQTKPADSVQTAAASGALKAQVATEFTEFGKQQERSLQNTLNSLRALQAALQTSQQTTAKGGSWLLPVVLLALVSGTTVLLFKQASAASENNHAKYY